MRRSCLKLLVAAIAGLAPAWALASDPQVAQEIANQLHQSGKFQGRMIGVKFEDGTVWLKGDLASQQQISQAISSVMQRNDVQKVVNLLTVESDTSLAPPAAPGLPAKVEEPPRPTSVARLRLENLFEDDTPSQNVMTERTAGQYAQRFQQVSGVEPKSVEIKQAEPVAVTLPAPQPSAGPSDLEVSQQIAKELSQLPALRGQRIGVKYDGGTLTLKGNVQNPGQMLTAVQAAKGAPGVKKVISQIKVTGGDVNLVSGANTAVQQAKMRRGAYSQLPLDQARPVSHQAAMAHGMQGGPTPLAPSYVMGAGGGARPVSYDQPHLPNYAWPSYAASPNYAGLTYPTQHSAAAWPYIGPFYPYPQVPLGWRKVTLEWDDGWWFLDFQDKR